MEPLSLMGVLGASRCISLGVLGGGPTSSDHQGQVMTTDVSMINSSMEKAMELGTLGNGGRGPGAEFRTRDP